ncbi:MAG: DUF3237 domain-containing protein [Acidimicrobiales bacterium]
MRPVELRELLVVEIRVRPTVDLGGGRRCIPFEGGMFNGEGALEGTAGTVLEGGVDWQTIRSDGTLDIDAHYTLQSDKGEAIEVRSQGIRKASEAVAARITRGDVVAPDEYYFRTHVRLSTSSRRLGWLNDLLAVSTGEREQATARIHVHEIL